MTKREETQEIDGRSCQLFYFEYIQNAKGKFVISGDVWLDAVSGAPVYSEVSYPIKIFFFRGLNKITYYNIYEDRLKIREKTETNTLPVTMIFWDINRITRSI